MTLFSSQYLESLLFSGKNLENDITLKNELDLRLLDVENNLNSENPNVLYAVDFLISLMTIDSCTKFRKEIDLKKEFKSFKEILWNGDYKKLKGLLIGYFSNNKTAVFESVFNELKNTNFKAKHVNRHYNQNYTVLMCNLFTVSDHKEASKFISSNKLLIYYYYFIKVHSMHMINLIKEDVNSYKYFNFLPPNACEEVINQDPSKFFLLDPQFINYSVFCLGLKKNCVSLKENFSFKNFHNKNNLYSRIDFSIFSKNEIETLISLDFDLVNYVNIKEHETKICNKIREDYRYFLKIKNPTLEICLFSLKIEEFSLLKDNIDLTDIGIENDEESILMKKAKLYLEIKIVENQSHKITVKNLENKIKLKKLINY